MENNVRLQALLDQYLAGNNTSEELDELGDYLNDPVYELQIKECLSNAFLDLNGVEMPDSQQRFILESIYNKARNTNAKPAVITLWPKIAAAVAVILVAGASILYFNHKPAGNNTAAIVKSNIQPGGNKAILTLANGQKISLTDALNGTIAQQAGVSIRKTANGQLIYDLSNTRNDANKIEYNTIAAPAGGQWQVILPDGSHVWLNALSSLTYPTQFTGMERNVELSGEGYFEISHNKLKPFKVKSKGQTVEVLGTHFNIMAYADEKEIKTTLLEGSVRISKNNKTQVLKPGQQANTTPSTINVTSNVDLEEVIAWKEGYFKFHESLESILNKVARWYDVEIIYQGNVNRKRAYVAEIPRTKDITTLLNIIASTETVHFKIDGRRVIVME